MSEKFQIGPGWAAVIVAIIIPTLGGIWYFATSQARTETTVGALDKRTEKIEAKLDAIAEKLQVRPASMEPTATIKAATDCKPVEPVRFVAARPFP